MQQPTAAGNVDMSIPTSLDHRQDLDFLQTAEPFQPLLPPARETKGK